MSTSSVHNCIKHMQSLASGGNNNGPPNNHGGGGGGGGGQELFQLAVAEEDEEEVYENEEDFEEGEIDEYMEEDLDEEDYVDPTAPFECNKVTAVGLPKGPGVPRDVDLFAGLHCQQGFRCTQEELRKDLKTLSQYYLVGGD